MIYSREFVVNSDWKGKRIRLVFEAVDYEAKVMVNGREVGSHQGGYDSFSFDITNCLNMNGVKEHLSNLKNVAFLRLLITIFKFKQWQQHRARPC